MSLDRHGTVAVKEPCPYPYKFIEFSLIALGLSAALICGRSCVVLKANGKDLLPDQQHRPNDDSMENPDSSLYVEYLKYAENFDDAIIMEAFEEWLTVPLRPLLHELHRETQLEKPKHLSEYLRPNFHHLSLKNLGGQLLAIPCEHDELLEKLLFPGVDATELGIDLSTVDSSELTIHPDHELVIQNDDVSEEWGLCDIPRRVVFLKDPALSMAFKGLQDIESSRRELQMLLTLRKHPNRKTLQIPELIGLVERTGLIAGFLTKYIDHRYTLGDVHCGDQSAYSPAVRRLWQSQIEDAVQALHDMGLVWGDAKPENILIDKK